jgi:hypothetical protein
MKRRSGPAWAKKPWGFTVWVMASIWLCQCKETAARSEAWSYHFALEWPPHHGAVTDGELGEAAPRENAALGDVKCVHDGNDVIVTRACALDILDQLGCDELVHVPPEI